MKNIDWNHLAEKLEEKYGESLCDENADPFDPLNYFLEDVTVYDIVEFLKHYFDEN